MRPEPLALTLDQTQFYTAAALYETDHFKARVRQMRDYLGLPVATFPTRPWSEEECDQ